MECGRIDRSLNKVIVCVVNEIANLMFEILFHSNSIIQIMTDYYFHIPRFIFVKIVFENCFTAAAAAAGRWCYCCLNRNSFKILLLFFLCVPFMRDDVFITKILITYFFFFAFFLLQAVKEFTEIINRNFERKNISPATALKFLLARKFDVQRAVALFEQHELIRQQEGLYTLDPMIDPLRSELETGKFTILVSYLKKI